MNDSPEQKPHHHVIPFSRRDLPVNDHETEWERLKPEVLAAIREGVAMADDIGADERDRHVIADERAFIARFGFDRPRRDREGLIRLKHAKDLTDREIRLLKLACAIRFGTHGVQLAASRSMAVFGRAVMTLLALEMVDAWYLATHSPLRPPILVLRLVGVMVMLLLMGRAIHQLYVRPWQIQQRTRCRPQG